MLANPRAMELLRPPEPDKKKLAWEEFRKDGQFRRTHQITSDEMEMLSSVALMGEIYSARDFIYILNTIRQALRR